jgi:hypothetical protein
MGNKSPIYPVTKTQIVTPHLLTNCLTSRSKQAILPQQRQESRPLNSKRPPSYLPYFSLAYNMPQPRANVMEFHIMTEGKPNEIPYDNQKAIPRTNKEVKVKLISWALLSLNRRHTCGTNPPVVKMPPTNPRSSFQSKCTPYGSCVHSLKSVDNLSSGIICCSAIIPPPLQVYQPEKYLAWWTR